MSIVDQHLAANPADVTGTLWHVLYTRSRQEKVVERALVGKGISVFLPAFKRVMFYGHRKRTVRAPLFSSYLFMRGDLNDVHTALNTRQIVRRVPVFDQSRLDYELTQIRMALEASEEFLPASYLETGTPVRVTRGPMKGVEGIVEAKRFPNRLVLQIHTLGRATSLEIDMDLLEPIGD